MTATIKVDNNGNWPDGWSRTPIGNRRTRVQWRKPQEFYLEALVKELSRMGSMSVLVSYGKNERLDPGVSVYFTRVSDLHDFSWQYGLGLFSPTPTIEEIDSAFRVRAAQYHPDRGGDIETFKQLTHYRELARNWVLGKERNDNHQHVICCDRYAETRLNLAACRFGAEAIHRLETAGIPGLLERTLNEALKALPPRV